MNKIILKIQEYSSEQRKAALLLVIIPLVTACTAATVITGLKTFASVFAGNLITTASNNYSPRYGRQLDELLQTLVPKVGQQPGQQVQNTYTATNQQSYGNQGQQGGYQDQGYQDQGYQDQYVQQDGYQDQSYQDQYAQQGQYQQQAAMQYEVSNQAPAPGTVSMQIDILAQRNNSAAPPSPIQDGETLFSVRGNPQAGDKIKFSFRANCRCYVYVVAVDATGYVVSAFPDEISGMRNPVQAQRQYVFPAGTEWYGLDDFTGVENIYFIASKNQRHDLEQIIRQMAETPRNINANSYRPVQVAAIPPTRGLVRISAPSMQSSYVQSAQGTTYKYQPTTFANKAANADLVITRWFHHK